MSIAPLEVQGDLLPPSPPGEKAAKRKCHARCTGPDNRTRYGSINIQRALQARPLKEVVPGNDYLEHIHALIQISEGDCKSMKSSPWAKSHSVQNHSPWSSTLHWRPENTAEERFAPVRSNVYVRVKFPFPFAASGFGAIQLEVEVFANHPPLKPESALVGATTKVCGGLNGLVAPVSVQFTSWVLPTFVWPVAKLIVIVAADALAQPRTDKINAIPAAPSFDFMIVPFFERTIAPAASVAFRVHLSIKFCKQKYQFLRVCPKTSGGITKFSEHEAD